MEITRRDFIKTSAVGIAAFFAPHITLEKPSLTLEAYLSHLVLPRYVDTVHSDERIILKTENWQQGFHAEWIRFLKHMYDYPNQTILEYGRLVEERESVYDTLTYERPLVVEIFRLLQYHTIVGAKQNGKEVQFPLPGVTVRPYLFAYPYITKEGLKKTCVLYP